MITAQPDWNDVVRRATRHRRRSVTVRAAAVAALALVVATPAFGLGVGGWLHSLEPGHVVPDSQLPRGMAFEVTALPAGAKPGTFARSFHPRDLRRVVRSGPESFYVIDLRNGLRCYGAGPAGARAVLSVVGCPSATQFPSAAEPILDLSTRDAGTRSVAAGIAVDGVASVGITDRQGRVVARARVADNVFARGRLPAGAVGKLVPFDAAGRRVGAARGSAGAACRVKAYFAPDATTQDIASAIATARTTPHVVRLTFVSKAAALAAMKKHYPQLTKNLAGNPLPSSIRIVPDSPQAAGGIVAALRAQHLAGVVRIVGCRY